MCNFEETMSSTSAIQNNMKTWESQTVITHTEDIGVRKGESIIIIYR